jgi:hypothetical protein
MRTPAKSARCRLTMMRLTSVSATGDGGAEKLLSRRTVQLPEERVEYSAELPAT